MSGFFFCFFFWLIHCKQSSKVEISSHSIFSCPYCVGVTLQIVVDEAVDVEKVGNKRKLMHSVSSGYPALTVDTNIYYNCILVDGHHSFSNKVLKLE